MDILLYNPLSRNGKKIKLIEKAIKNLSKTGQPVVSHNILEIKDKQTFMQSLHKNDRIIIVGGDGTINRLANAIYQQPFEQELFMYQAGTGNDFVRSLRTKSKIVPIKSHIQKLPSIEYLDQKRLFLNGVGAGLDGYIGHLVNHSRFKKNKLNYFRHTFEGFAQFKPIKATIVVDGKSYREEKLWFASMMNSAYFGGGMKIAPQADRTRNDLDLVVVKKVSKLLLFFIFPTIYLGLHVYFKKWVTVYRGQSMSITFDQPTYLQIDGDVEYPIETFSAHAFE
jgi:diacylglycerol kinase (ATP)